MIAFRSIFRAAMALLLVFALPQPLKAGAWMRGERTGFYSITTKMTYDLRTIQSGYLEYGVNPRLTFGASVDMTMIDGYAASGTGYLFMRKPLKWNRFDGIWAYELGVGARLDATQRTPIAKTTLHYGRGIKLRQKAGWLAVDGGFEWDLNADAHMAKVDVTVGLNLTPQSKAMLQLFSTFTAYDATFTLAPSYIFTPKEKKISYVVGFEAASHSSRSMGIKVGIWQTF